MIAFGTRIIVGAVGEIVGYDDNNQPLRITPDGVIASRYRSEMYCTREMADMIAAEIDRRATLATSAKSEGKL